MNGLKRVLLSEWIETKLNLAEKWAWTLNGAVLGFKAGLIVGVALGVTGYLVLR